MKRSLFRAAVASAVALAAVALSPLPGWTQDDNAYGTAPDALDHNGEPDGSAQAYHESITHFNRMQEQWRKQNEERSRRFQQEQANLQEQGRMMEEQPEVVIVEKAPEADRLDQSAPSGGTTRQSDEYEGTDKGYSAPASEPDEESEESEKAEQTPEAPLVSIPDPAPVALAQTPLAYTATPEPSPSILPAGVGAQEVVVGVAAVAAIFAGVALWGVGGKGKP